MTSTDGTTVRSAGAPHGSRARTAHRRQFVVGHDTCSLVADWNHVRFGELWLSHCPTLPVDDLEDGDGRRWAILGRAVETRADRPAPRDQLAAARTADVPMLTVGWSGRWVLVNADELHLDATGLLGCFTTRDARGRPWASSSPVLAARLSSEREPEPHPWPLRYEDPVSWVIPPRSRYNGVRRLLPSQVLALTDGSVRPRPLIADFDPTRRYADTLSLIHDALSTALRRLAGTESAWLGLTAGADSRLILSTVAETGAAVRTFTRRSPRSSLADLRLPPVLAGIAGVEHAFVDGARTADAASLVSEHTGGHVGAGDAEPFLHGDRARLGGRMIGGWGSAMGREFRDLSTGPNDPLDDVDSLRRALRLTDRSPSAVAFDEWLQWVSESPQPSLELRDRFSIEQRYAGWLSSKEQLYDLDAVERVPLLNASRIIGMLLSLPEEARVTRRWQHELIGQIAPDLAALPYNPPDRFFGVVPAVWHRARHPLVSARRVGRRARWKAYAAMSAIPRR